MFSKIRNVGSNGVDIYRHKQLVLHCLLLKGTRKFYILNITFEASDFRKFCYEDLKPNSIVGTKPGPAVSLIPSETPARRSHCHFKCSEANVTVKLSCRRTLIVVGIRNIAKCHITS